MGRKIICVSALALTLGLTLTALAGSPTPVKVQATAGSGGTITVTIDIAKGWHIYANPVNNEDLKEAATVVDVRSGGKGVETKTQYPAGTKHEEKGVGSYQVYEGQVTIPVRVLDGAAGPREVRVRYMACDAKRCLPPATVKITLP